MSKTFFGNFFIKIDKATPTIAPVTIDVTVKMEMSCDKVVEREILAKINCPMLKETLEMMLTDTIGIFFINILIKNIDRVIPKSEYAVPYTFPVMKSNNKIFVTATKIQPFVPYKIIASIMNILEIPSFAYGI